MAGTVVMESILCEECYNLFNTYLVVEQIFNAESSDGLSEFVKTGKVNRVVCHKCKAEFTYECPILIISNAKKVAAICCFDEKELPKSHNFSTALKMLKCENIILRITNFASEAAEKIRIAYYDLDDLKTELFKLKYFEEYYNMDLSNEYIAFFEINNDMLVFKKCDYKDNVISTFRISKSQYDNFKPKYTPPPRGKWIRINRSTAIRLSKESHYV